MGLETIVFGNTILGYIIYLAILLVGLAIGKLVSLAMSTSIRAFTAKTVTKIDDVLVDVCQGPLVFAIFVGVFAFGERFLVLPVGAAGVYDQVVRLLSTIVIAWFLIRFLDSVIEHYVTPFAAKSKSDLDDVILPILQTAGKIVVISIMGIMILSDFGFNVTGLVAGLGIGGLAFAFAAKDLIANIFGGISVIADKPFKINDMIKFDGKQGSVRQIGIRTTRIETLEGTTLVIPNAKFTEGIIENVTNRKKHRVTLVLGLEYGTPSKKVKLAKDILLKVIKEQKGAEDKPTVFFSAFNSSSIDLTLHYYVTDLTAIPAVQDTVNMAIKERFEKARIEFAYPTQTVIVRK